MSTQTQETVDIDLDKEVPCSVTPMHERREHTGAAKYIIRFRCPSCGRTRLGQACEQCWELMGRTHGACRGCYQTLTRDEFVKIIQIL